jgi:tetratricopeptide (TPR) repeat protein
VGLFYKNYKRDLRTAITFFQTAMTLAISTGNTKEHSYALGCVALAKWSNGDPTGALIDAYECQRLARISGLLMHEARAIRIQVTCKIALGDYTQTIFLCKEARNLLHLCGLSGGYMDHATMTCQGDIHNVKSEYIEARNIHTQILHEVSADGDLSHYGWASLNIAETNMSMGAPCDEVERTLETARKLFSTIGHINAITMCDTVLARLYLRDGHIPAARALFENCLKISWGNEPQIISPCLESLANGSHWDAVDWMSVSGWTTVFLVHSLKFHQKLEIYKALQFLGDIFLTQDDETTAISLFSVALDGFTQMDVHRSRAECMLRFGDISKRHGKLLNAVELWGKARPLFERSSQSKQVQNIDDRLAGVGQDVLQQHQNNLARLAEPNVPLWPAVEEEAKDNPSDIEDMENMNSVEHKELNLVTG